MKMFEWKNLLEKIPWDKVSLITVLSICPIVSIIWTTIMIIEFPGVGEILVPLGYLIITLIATIEVLVLLLVYRYAK